PDVHHQSLSSTRARVADMDLKQYRRTVDPDSEALDLVEPGEVLPGTIQLGENASDAGISYRADRQQLLLHGAERGDVVFSADTPEGIHLEKRYRFSGEDYVFDVGVEATGKNPSPSVGIV